MTVAQIEHLTEMVNSWAEAMHEKYEAGVKEHGGNLWDMSITDLLDEALKENMDQFAYLWTARQKLKATSPAAVKAEWLKRLGNSEAI